MGPDPDGPTPESPGVPVMPSESPVGARSVAGWIARLAPCFAIALLTLALTVLTTRQAMARYRAMHTGWSWDLAYYNQWFWVLTHGGDRITVNPVSAYADEGPW